ncbi:hypothetical protein C7T94_00730 [Pedobacter yulinensis]|uniref:Uncharacterized protein n=1 Tax=Pedobacter yulinensis TaxID=2126353 RepID=A0A2T3HQL8_9SPHI|nr:hypothetical protein C7T94_00730 [Pedobacter yulinensis]
MCPLRSRDGSQADVWQRTLVTSLQTAQASASAVASPDYTYPFKKSRLILDVGKYCLTRAGVFLTHKLD